MLSIQYTYKKKKQWVILTVVSHHTCESYINKTRPAPVAFWWAR